MNQLTAFLGSGIGVFIVIFVVITGFLYFLIPWLVLSISNKIGKVLGETKAIILLMRDILKELKKLNHDKENK